MPYSPHVLFAMQGTLTDAPGEMWECTMRLQLGAQNGTDTLDIPAWLASIQTPLGAWFSAGASGMAIAARLNTIKANAIKADGTYLHPTNTNTLTYATPKPGTQGGAVPGFCSLCYTWHTSRNRPPGARGRMYPPNFGYLMFSSFTVQSSDLTAAQTAAKGFLTVLANTAASNVALRAVPVIASKVDGSLQPVTGVSVNNVYDVQRRRKNRVQGARTAVVAFP